MGKAKTVVITGSSRGFGLALAKEFKGLGCNIVLSATNEKRLERALAEVKAIGSVAGKRPTAARAENHTQVIAVLCDVRSDADVCRLWDTAYQTFGSIDIWVNNAGVNSPNKPVCEMGADEVDYLLDVDLKGAILGSKKAFAEMREQGFGQIYNIEGYGSNDAMMTGLTLYGTAKRALTYFTRSLAKESQDMTAGAVKVCRLTPGIMITEFLTTSNGGKTLVELSEETKRIYNILGDYPETIAHYCAPKMLANCKNDANIVWLTGARSCARFLTSPLRKQDFFA